MSAYTTQDIRNLVLTGHHGCGKTTLAEALLHQAGFIKARGAVDKGNTVCDFEPEEKTHQYSMNSAVVHFQAGGRRVNLIDTPGMPDFIGHSLACFPAVETVAVVINADAGIEMISRRMMELAENRKLPRMIIINKIDSPAADLEALVASIQATFGPQCLPINLPANHRGSVIDCFTRAEGEADFSDVHAAHDAIVDQVVEVDEELMAIYLEQGNVTAEQLHAPFEKALREGHLVPICFTSAATGAGIAELLHLIIELLPNPLEGNPRPFLRGSGEGAAPFFADATPEKHLIAHVFKVINDPFVGKLGIFRVHQGTVTKDTQVYIGDGRKPTRIGHLFKLAGKEHVEVERCVPGDICAVAKMEEIHFNAVLHDDGQDGDIHFKPLPFPRPMAGYAIAAKNRGDETKIATALHRLASEDPCVEVERNAITHETVIRGLGEMHLRAMLEKIRNRYKLELDTHPPRIAYRETITAPAEGHHRHKKQTGGAGQFGEVYLRVKPLGRGEGFSFVNDTFGGSVPIQFIPAIEKGVREVLERGAVAGYPLQDLEVAVYDGKHHAVDSKEIAFVAAGRKAFIDAIQKARPVLLEPIVKASILAPEGKMGEIASDLSGKRGHIQGTDTLPGGMVEIDAEVPLSEMTSYQSQLKSVTAGQGSFSMEFSHYAPVPMQVQQQIMSEYKPHVEED